jgi:hypothetical protein
VKNPVAQRMLEAFNQRARVALAAIGAAGNGGFGGLGECFGFVSTAILFKNGVEDRAWSGGLTRSALLGAGGLSDLTPQNLGKPGYREAYARLRDTTRERQLFQTSWTYVSWWEQWATARQGLSGSSLYGIMAPVLNGGKTLGLSFYWPAPGGGQQGHAVLARGISGTPGSFRVALYDPNYPGTGDVAFVVEGDRWYVEGDSENLYPKSGSAQPLAQAGSGQPSVIVLSEEQMTTRKPTPWWSSDRRGVPHPFIGGAAITADRVPNLYLQASQGRIAQVVDDRGRRALAPGGGPNRDRRTSIPGAFVRTGLQAPTQITVPSGRKYTVSIVGDGAPGATLFTWDRSAYSAVNAEVQPGQAAVVQVDGAARALSMSPVSRGSGVISVISKVGKGRYRAAEAASRRTGGRLGVAVDPKGTVTVDARGGASRPELRLGVLGNGYGRVVRADAGGLRSGEALAVSPRWGDLKGDLRATRTGQNADEPVTLEAREITLDALRRVELDLASARGRRTVEWDVALRRAADVSVTVEVTYADGRPCGLPRRVFTDESGRWRIPTLPPGKYRVGLGVAAQDRENPFLVQRRSTTRTFTVGGRG